MEHQITVNTIYQKIMLRPVDAQGMQYWAELLQNGAISIEQLTQNLLNSREFSATVQPILDIYSTYFLRSADSEELSYWSNSLRDGLSLSQIKDNFKASPEYQAITSDVNEASWLTKAYNNLLGRNIDKEGTTYWLSMLDSGMTRESITEAIANSDEGAALEELRSLKMILGDQLDNSEANIDSLLGDFATSIEEAVFNPDFGLGEHYQTGTSDASAAIAVGERLMLVADDEDQVLRLYERDSDGAPLASINLNDALGLNDTQEVDLEAVATYQGVQYWIGSHETSQRSMVFATHIGSSTLGVEFAP